MKLKSAKIFWFPILVIFFGLGHFSEALNYSNSIEISNETSELINIYLNVRVFSIPAELVIYILVGFYLGIQKTKISSLLIVKLTIILFTAWFSSIFNTF